MGKEFYMMKKEIEYLKVFGKKMKSMGKEFYIMIIQQKNVLQNGKKIN